VGDRRLYFPSPRLPVLFRPPPCARMGSSPRATDDPRRPRTWRRNDAGEARGRRGGCGHGWGENDRRRVPEWGPRSRVPTGGGRPASLAAAAAGGALRRGRLRPPGRGRLRPHPHLLPRAVGVRADRVRARPGGGRASDAGLHPRLLPSRPAPLRRTDDDAAAAGDAQEPQGAALARVVPQRPDQTPLPSGLPPAAPLLPAPSARPGAAPAVPPGRDPVHRSRDPGAGGRAGGDHRRRLGRVPTARHPAPPAAGRGRWRRGILGPPGDGAGRARRGLRDGQARGHALPRQRRRLPGSRPARTARGSGRAAGAAGRGRGQHRPQSALPDRLAAAAAGGRGLGLRPARPAGGPPLRRADPLRRLRSAEPGAGRLRPAPAAAVPGAAVHRAAGGRGRSGGRGV
ncbi:MAG: Hypoxanthine-guanine phosphoribosyltransferase, partial [uncultured Thermomicrobiales bacterium]